MSFNTPPDELPLDRLCGDRPGRCLGAAFTTYTFDTKFFEEKVLPGVFDIRADPEQDIYRFLEECRARIVEAPVVVIADGGHIEPGRRVPYDLLEVHGRVFHPKVSLLLFEKSARLSVGSGNLTEGGFGGNSELFCVRELSYDEPSHRALLRSVCAFFEATRSLVRSPGTQLEEFLLQVRRLCPLLDEGEPDAMEPLFLHTASGQPLLAQLLSRIPEDATLVRVGLLAPFWEEDGEATDPSVLKSLQQAAEKRGRAAVFDIGLPWDDNPLAAEAGPIPPFEEALDRLWCLHSQNRADITQKWGYSGPALGFFTPVRLTATRLFTSDGESFPRADFEALRAERAVFPIGKVTTFAPANLLDEIERVAPKTGYWLFPAKRVEQNLLVQRPLHAKLIVIHTRKERRDVSWILVGSPNLSRRALLQAPPQANVEAALLFRVDERVELNQLVGWLVNCSRDLLTFEERQFDPPRANWSTLVRRAIYTPDQRVLEVEWDESRPAPGPFRLVYPAAPERELYVGSTVPAGVSRYSDFTLELAIAELNVCVGEEVFPVQIEVANLAALPVSPLATDFHLEELLLRFMGRWGPEKLRQQRQPRTRNDVIEALVVFGEAGFQPADVFRAWWGLSRELGDPLLTVGGLRVLLEGPGGARMLWERMRQAIAADKLTPEEVWFYGLELHRALSALHWPEGQVGQEKAVLVRAFLGALMADVKALAPSGERFRGLDVVNRFYRFGVNE